MPRAPRTRDITHLITQLMALERDTGGLFEELLMAALDRAVPLWK
ncbi:MAG: hypothetical protein R3E12_08450 [Candidatus Eisenbacteria bacterium]